MLCKAHGIRKTFGALMNRMIMLRSMHTALLLLHYLHTSLCLGSLGLGRPV